MISSGQETAQLIRGVDIIQSSDQVSQTIVGVIVSVDAPVTPSNTVVEAEGRFQKKKKKTLAINFLILTAFQDHLQSNKKFKENFTLYGKFQY